MFLAWAHNTATSSTDISYRFASDKRPIEVVPADTQRAALQFVIASAFGTEAYGLSPKLLTHMSLDKWWDEGSMMDEATWPVHDRVLGIQSSALTQLMNPATLRRIYDNEFRVPADEDAFTLPEMLNSLTKAIWKEIEDVDTETKFTARKPLIGSMERNLQREYVERLADLISPSAGSSAAYKPIYDLASTELRALGEKLEEFHKAKNLDPYSKAHLCETQRLIEKSLDASVVMEVKGGGLGRGGSFFLFGQDGQLPVQP